MIVLTQYRRVTDRQTDRQTTVGLTSVLPSGYAMPSNPASTNVHANVHCVNLFCISFCTACYLVFTDKMEW